VRGVEEEDGADEWEELVVGRSSCIDKPYLRITGRPDADTVRPEPILKQALAHFLREHKQATTPYDLLISQLKSIRQDLTVQHIRNAFTVQVYEENFKMSLFENDIIQVKHCQANLW
jgi:SAC3 family protein LENG8/THP3